MSKLAITPVYTPFKGWSTDITGLSSFASVPEAMKDYIRHINAYLGAEIKYISNGPGRDQIIPIL